MSTRALPASAGAVTGPTPTGGWFATWLRTAFVGTALLVAVFAVYELFERTALRGASPATLHWAHIARGAGSSVLLGTWAFLRIRLERLRAERLVQGHLRELERHIAERTQQIREAHEFSELLLDSLREKILVLDARGELIKANRAAREGSEAQVRATGRAGVSLGEHSDEQGRLWEIETIPVCDPGSSAPRFSLQVQRDVTARRSLEAQVRHQEKMAGLGLMAAGFAHDLGNPLASISSELELSQGETDLARVHDSLAILQKHVHRMSRTLREMVDFSRRRRDHRTDVSVSSVVADALRLVRHDPRWRRVRVETEVPDTLPPVRMVEDHLLLVLLNLFVNSADAMPDGGTVTVSARDRGAEIELRVRDTGVGMPPEVLAQATRPMFTTKPPGLGTGLGLSVSLDVVRAAGGSLEIQSEPHRGTEVRIALPTAGTPSASLEESHG